jgi:hypothetical protein
MDRIKNFIKSRQQPIILVVGYVLVAGLGFGLGQISASSYQPPEIRVEEAFLPPNHSSENPTNQLSTIPSGQTPVKPQGLDCAGQIKGNIGSKGEKVYHMPGGSFYNRTTPEACFGTEAEAVAAGFRKSKN